MEGQLTPEAKQQDTCDAFRECFSTAAGKVVLEHLERICGARSCTDISPKRAVFAPDGQHCLVDVPIDPIKYWREDGMRAIYWLIVSSCEKSDGALKAWERVKTERNLAHGRV